MRALAARQRGVPRQYETANPIPLLDTDQLPNSPLEGAHTSCNRRCAMSSNNRARTGFVPA